MIATTTIRLLAAALMLAIGVQDSAAEEPPARQLQAFLKTVRSLSADFKQVILNEAGNPVQTSFGTFLLARPGKFRWDYQSPFQQQIVANNGKVWFYDHDLEQVTIKKLDQSLGSAPALLLTGDIGLDENFIIENQGVEDNMQWLRLAPKSPESTFKYILLGLDKGKLAGMELSDNFGQLTRIYFSKVLINPPVKSSVFDFQPPKGADVFTE